LFIGILNAPILLTVYNRLDHLEQCINHLLRCEGAAESVIYISSDAPYKNQDQSIINKIRDYIKTVSGFLEVIPIFHETNKGLKQVYYSSLELIFKKYDRFIFLEDDVLVAPDFLTYMNQGLNFYQNDSRIYSVSAFSFSIFHSVSEEKRDKVYFTNRFYPWGYGQWRDRVLTGSEYSLQDLNNSLKDSDFIERLNKSGKDLEPSFLSLKAQNKMLLLDYLNTYHMVKYNLFTIVPYQSKSFNIGHDGSGSRTIKNKRFQATDISFLNNPTQYQFLEFSEAAIDNTFNKLHFSSRLNRIKIFLKRLGLLRLAMKFVNKYRGKS
jgi:hypothetical protein